MKLALQKIKFPITKLLKMMRLRNLCVFYQLTLKPRLVKFIDIVDLVRKYIERQGECFQNSTSKNLRRNILFISGTGITHKVNNILIQFGGTVNDDFSPNPPKSKKSRRSFDTDMDEQNAEVYLSSKRIGPNVINFKENCERQLLFNECEKRNFAWCLLRYQHSIPLQVIPSWTGFNISIQNNVAVMKASIHYMNSINSPAINMSTIYQVRKHH